MGSVCTLHPLDPRLAESLRKSILGHKCDWSYLWRNYRQKMMINRVNQRLKTRLPDLLADVPVYAADLHQWGRPFLIADDDPVTVARKIAALYQTSDWTGVLRIYLDELAVFKAAAARQAATFEYPALKTDSPGLGPAVRELQRLFRLQKYREAGMEVPFVLAQLAALSYPYWYLNGFGISYLGQLHPPGWDGEPNGLTALFPDLPQLHEHFPRRLEHRLSAGIYLDPEEVVELLEIIEAGLEEIVNMLALKQFTAALALKILQKTAEALTYAKFHHYGLLEAADVFDAANAPYP